MTIHVPDEVLEPYTQAAGGDLDEAKRLMRETLREHPPEYSA